MTIFKNYLQRLIEANTAADAEAGQSGATVAQPSIEMEANAGADGNVTWDTFYNTATGAVAPFPASLGLTHLDWTFTAAEAGRWIVEAAGTSEADATAIVTLGIDVSGGSSNAGGMIGKNELPAGRDHSIIRVVDLPIGGSFLVRANHEAATAGALFQPFTYLVGKITRLQ